MDKNVENKIKLAKWLKDNNLQLQMKPTLRLMKNGLFAVGLSYDLITLEDETAVVETAAEPAKEEEKEKEAN